MNNKKTKKNIKKFLNSEEGKMLNADVVKLGLSLGVIGAAAAPDDVSAGVTITHSNWFWLYGPTGGNHYSHVSHGSHSSHGSHGSHSSHGSHARGGWC